MAFFASKHPFFTPTENRISVTVIRSETEVKEGRKFTKYIIQVKCSGQTSQTSDSWIVSRRYHEFEQLYQILKKVFPDAALKLPGKRILLLNNFDPSFIEQRRLGLNLFMQQVSQDIRLMKHESTREFLRLSRGLESSPSPEPLTSSSVKSHSMKMKNGVEPNLIDLGPSERRTVKPSDFEFLKVIGKGSFGKVLLSRHKEEGTIYAVKVLQKQQIRKNNEIRHIMSERNILLKNVKHPFLVGLHYSFQTSDKLYFVLDYVNGGELFHHLQKERHFSESRSRFYAAEITSALGYLHKLGIIYRDLKPENLLLDSEGHICLTDFGLCKEGINTVEGETTTTFCGTPEYLAPEILRKLPYTAVVDWWCLGAVLYEMLYGLPPFYSRDTAEMYDGILHKPLRLRPTVSETVRDLLELLLQKDPRHRLGYEGDVQDVAAHPFFQPINWQLLNERKIKPPYNPNVTSLYDLRHIDPEFTLEPVPSSVSNNGFHGATSLDNTFAGFTYVPPIEGL